MRRLGLARIRGVQPFLQTPVQLPDARRAPVHRAEDLDLVRAQAEFTAMLDRGREGVAAAAKWLQDPANARDAGAVAPIVGAPAMPADSPAVPP